jgi:plasmid replication initiation protein
MVSEDIQQRLPCNTATFTLQYSNVYLAIQQRLPCNKQLNILCCFNNIIGCVAMSELIVKDNALMNASYNLDLVEQRLILLAIVEARESGKGINANDPLTIHAETYINQFGVHRNTAYQALKDACKDLFARQFSYQEKRAKGTANITSRWVSQIAYVDDSAYVELIFAPAIVPLVTRLEEEFTRYDIDQVSSLTSAYAVRMYEILIQWRTVGKTPVIDLQEFRKRLGVLDSEHLRIEALKRRVVEVAIKQINEHTDITASYEQHKHGRVITGFSFKFKHKPAPAERDKTPEQDVNALLTDEFVGKHAQVGESWEQARTRLRKEAATGKFSLSLTP